MKDKLTFSLFTPKGQLTCVECDGVRLSIADSASGEFSGSYGIRRGHAKAVLSLAEGKIFATDNGQEIFSAECSGGFAIVDNNEVRVTVDKAEKNM